MMQSNSSAPDHGAGCGDHLRRAREDAGLSLQEVSSRLKMPVRVLRALEADDWASLGAPVFVRGQLRSYARLLQIDIEPHLHAIPVAVVTPPELVSHTHTPRYRRVAEQAGRRAIYIVLTAAIALPVWLATRPHLTTGSQPSVQPLDIPVAENGQPTGNAAPAQRLPLVASMASLPPAAQPAAALTLTFNGDSWVQIYAPDGTAIEQGLMGAGDTRRFEAGQVGRVVLGNSSAVQVQSAGQGVDLAPFSRANVARFTLSSDGSLAPVSH